MSVLHTSVLVLNQNYEPLNVCNARRAVVLLDRGKAEIVENGERIIHTVMRAVSIPSVIRMVYFVKRPRPVARLSRREIFARDGYRCQYCGHATRDLTLDHVQPRSRGGNHSWENLTSACKACNHRKAGRTPAEARMRLRTDPKQPRPSLYSVFARHLAGHRTWRTFFPGAPPVAEDESEAGVAASGD
jgi:5-methylcytosine-specific restriction endonuclease McrA